MEGHALKTIADVIGQTMVLQNKAAKLGLSDDDFAAQLLAMEPAFEAILDGGANAHPKDYHVLVKQCIALATNALVRNT